MALTTEEIFDNIEALAKNLKGAVQEESDGGKTITKAELMDIAVAFISKFGVDVID